MEGLVKFDYSAMEDVCKQLGEIITEVENIKGRLNTLAKTEAGTWSSQDVAMYEALMAHANKGVATMSADVDAINAWSKQSGGAFSALAQSNSSSYEKMYSAMFGKA
ncbi:MAG: hypothetical protein VZR06_01390 [Butyrivibrio sp.]|nr:hypothetical protein [Butyrivibrio sp.]